MCLIPKKKRNATEGGGSGWGKITVLGTNRISHRLWIKDDGDGANTRNKKGREGNKLGPS